MAMLLCFGTADAGRRKEQLIKVDGFDPRTEHVQRLLKSSSKKTKSQNTGKSSKKSKAGSLLQTSQSSDTQQELMPVEGTNEHVKDIELELEDFLNETELDINDGFGIISPVRHSLPN